MGHVRFGGARGDEQGGRDLGVGHAQAHQPEHLAFAVGDPGQFPGLAVGTVLVGELPDQAAGDARRDHGVAGRDHADGGQDVLQCHVLDQEPARPGPQRAVDVVILVERGEHEHLGVRTGGVDQLGCLDAVHARHADVHDDHVGAGVPGEPYRLGSGSGLAGHVDIGGRSINLRNPARTSGWSSARMTWMITGPARAPAAGRRRGSHRRGAVRPRSRRRAARRARACR